MTVTKILRSLRPGPTMLTLSQMTFVMQSLQSIASEALEKEKGYLFNVLDMLIESYCYAEVPGGKGDESIILQGFIAWLLNLAQSPVFNDDRLALVAYSEMLSATMQARL